MGVQFPGIILRCQGYVDMWDHSTVVCRRIVHDCLFFGYRQSHPESNLNGLFVDYELKYLLKNILFQPVSNRGKHAE